jgi:hypothetical protein
MEAATQKRGQSDAGGLRVSPLADRCRSRRAVLISGQCVTWFGAARCAGIGVWLLLTALGASQVAAQSDVAAVDERADAPAEAIDEITVIGQRSLRELRLEVQAARERVYDIFNSLNSDDDFDIHCRRAVRTGTRIPQRVCEPQFVPDIVLQATRWYVTCLMWGTCDGQGLAQAITSQVFVKEMQLEWEVQRLTREHREVRQMIAEYQAVERRYEDARRAVTRFPESAVSIVETVSGSTRAGRASRVDSIAAPRPVDVAAPDTRARGGAADADRAGWVKLRYSVLADGRPAEVRVVDAMPPGLDPSSAVAAARSWSFEPARSDGHAIDWHNNVALIAFNRRAGVYEGWTDFAGAYEAVAELIAGGQYRDAKSLNERVLREYAFNFEDIGLAQMQLAAIEHALGDPQAALTAIRRATEPGVRQLADAELMLALEHRFALELELGHAADALRSYERRAALGRLRSRDPLARQGAALRDALASPQSALAIQGRIGANGEWEHALTRETFEIGDVNGRSETLDVDCHRGKVALPVEEHTAITIPAAWGECVLTIRGRPDSTFTLYEFSETVSGIAPG